VKIWPGQGSLLLLVSVLLVCNTVYAEPQGQPAALTGWLSIIWRDGKPGTTVSPEPVYLLTSVRGETVRLLLPEAVARAAGGILKLDRKRVTATGLLAANPHGAGRASLHVHSIRGADPSPAPPEGVAGSQPWVSILCKFADVAAEPKTLSYFQGMYGSSYPGLDHYWREQSFNTVNVAGSTAVGWYTLPQPRSYYVYDTDGDGSVDVDLDRAADDCTGVADTAVNFPNFVGINLMFNDHLDGFAWGGSHHMERDGVTRTWRMTWEPPWGYTDITVMGHEMGHGFGLPHSSGQYGVVYDNQWDVMSDTWSNCSRSTDVTYGCLGQHTISYHKDRLAWIPPSEKFNAPGGQSTITLEQLALPQTSNYKMAEIPIDGSGNRFYTVEARRRTGYDYKLPGQGVIIHDVDLQRSRPANVVDADNNGNTGDSGAIWEAGETFVDAANSISVAVNSATATGWVVTITSRTATATTLVSSDDSSVVGQSVTFTATVTSGVTGNVIFRDGDATLATVPLSGNQATYTTSALAAGTHSITAEYAGNAENARSTSDSLQQQVRQPSTTSLTSSSNPSADAAPVMVAASVPDDATGHVAFYDGAELFAYGYPTGGVATVERTWYQPGTHWVTAQYSGDSIYEPSTSAVLYQVVQPEAGAPTGLVATATSATQVSLTWNAVPTASYYYVQRLANGEYSYAGSPTASSLLDSGLTANTTYFYSIAAVSPSSEFFWSAPEPATTVLFTNDPVASGGSIKALHVTQLRMAVNAFRATAGLPVATFTDPAIAAGSTVVKAAHIAELRAALDAARARRFFPPVSYSGGVLTIGTRIRAVNVQQLRNGTK
jgi:M6 family metalloprotease-like protein